MDIQVSIRKNKILFFLFLIIETFSQVDVNSCLFEGKYFDLINQECTNCQENCNRCDRSSQCQECNIGFSLDQNYLCIEKCPLGQYLNNSTKKCTQCLDFNCKECTFGDYCIKCKDGFELSSNQICIDQVCKYVKGIYQKDIDKCSLDNYLLDENVKFSENQTLNRNGLTTFSYSSYGEDRQEDIKEINIYKVYDVYKLVATSNQFLTIYDLKSMTVLKHFDMQGCIYQTIFKDNALLILVAFNLQDKYQKFEYNQQKYLILQFDQVDLMTYLKQTKQKFDNNPIDAILTQNNIFLQYQKYINIFDIAKLSSHSLKIDKKDEDIVSISYLEIEKILMIETHNVNNYKALYFTDEIFKQITKILERYYYNIGKTITLSLIAEFDDKRRFKLYPIQKKDNDKFFSIDTGNVIRFVFDQNMKYDLLTNLKKGFFKTNKC